MEEEYKEVRFDKHCETCEHKGTDEHEAPCDECLGSPINLHSEKPVNYKEKED